MAEIVLTDCSLVCNAVNLSAWVRSITIQYNADAVENTAMGDTTHTRIGGLKDWSVSVEFNQDYAAAAVDQTLFGLVGSTFTFEGKPTSAAPSATNPKFTGLALLESYQPINGSVGELNTTSINLVAAGALTRATL